MGFDNKLLVWESSSLAQRLLSMNKALSLISSKVINKQTRSEKKLKQSG